MNRVSAFRAAPTPRTPTGQEATVNRLIVQGPRRRLRFGERSLAMRENEPDEGTLRALGFLH
jgi:hypothetical protein